MDNQFTEGPRLFTFALPQLKGSFTENWKIILCWNLLFFALSLPAAIAERKSTICNKTRKDYVVHHTMIKTVLDFFGLFKNCYLTS